MVWPTCRRRPAHYRDYVGRFVDADDISRPDAIIYSRKKRRARSVAATDCTRSLQQHCVEAEITSGLVCAGAVPWGGQGSRGPPLKLLPSVAPKKFKIRTSLAKIFRKLALH